VISSYLTGNKINNVAAKILVHLFAVKTSKLTCNFQLDAHAYILFAVGREPLSKEDLSPVAEQ
jgi:hypothetical protein